MLFRSVSQSRYCREFSQNKNLHKLFIYSVITVQIGVLILALPFLYMLLDYFDRFSILIFPVLGLFVINGTVEILRTLYHAHFWQKQFNTLQTFWLVLELSANFLLIYFLLGPWLTALCFSYYFGLTAGLKNLSHATPPNFPRTRIFINSLSIPLLRYK